MRLAFVIFIVPSFVVAYSLRHGKPRGLVTGSAQPLRAVWSSGVLLRRIDAPPRYAIDRGFRWQHVTATGTRALVDGGVVAVAVLPGEVISPARIVDLATPGARAERPTFPLGTRNVHPPLLDNLGVQGAVECCQA
jgi:hypothetical protein